MKRIVLSLSLILAINSVIAQTYDGSSCLNAIPVESSISKTCTPGDYWFSSTTFFLPLEFYCYPEDTTARRPDVWLDLTCEYNAQGRPVYEDENIANMMTVAGNYGLSFPMKENLDVIYDQDKFAYHVKYDANYRTMLYEQGVTYEVPAYVHVRVYAPCRITIESTSLHSECRNEAVSLIMNTQLNLQPADSTKLFIWPIGEWRELFYKITWQGEGDLQVYEGANCQVDNDHMIDTRYVMPADSIMMKQSASVTMIQERRIMETYLRMYPQSSGVLTIEEVDTVTKITNFVVGGVPAVIDQEHHTITAVLPYTYNTGAKRRKAIKEAEIAIYAYIPSNAFYVFDDYCETITIGAEEITYSLFITSAADTRSTNASLTNFTVGDSLFSETNGHFNACQLTYDDVEVTAIPTISATAADANASLTITQATTLPGQATIRVTAEYGNVQTYVINLIPIRSRDASLRDLQVDGVTIEGFAPDIYEYTVPVTHIPVVTAIPNDSNIQKLRVFDANRVPGYAYVQVIAEAGNNKSYQINFEIDPIILQCADALYGIERDERIAVGANDGMMQRMTINADVSDVTDVMWRNTYVSLNWSGDEPVTVYFLRTCDTNEENFADPVATYTLHKVKQETENHYVHYLTPMEVNALAKKAFDKKNLYVAIKEENHGAGTFWLSSWDEDCNTTSVDLDVNSEVTLPVGGFNTVYQFYDPEVRAHDSIRLVWECAQQDTLEVFMAKDCNFLLNPNNNKILQNGYHKIAPNTDWIISKTQWNNWYGDIPDYFYFARFMNNKTGTLRIETIDNVVINETICQGGSYWFELEGQYYTEATSKQFDIHKNGATYHVSLNLTVANMETQYDTLYVNELPAQYNGTTITERGLTTIHYDSENDCGYEVQLTVIQNVYEIEQVTLCEGKQLSVNNHTLQNDGETYSYLVEERDYQAFYKTVVLHIAPAEIIADTIRGELPITHNGKEFTAYGIYNDTILTEDGCTQIYQYVVWMPTTKDEYRSECQGGTVVVNGQIYTTNATVSVTEQTTYGDVTITYHISFVAPEIEYDTIYTTEPVNVSYQGQSITTFGQHTITYKDENACDHIVQLEVIKTTESALENNTMLIGQVCPTLANAGETITFTAGVKGQFSVTDVLGRVIMNAQFEEGAHNFSIPMAGQYLIRFVTTNGTEVIKLIVK